MQAAERLVRRHEQQAARALAEQAVGEVQQPREAYGNAEATGDTETGTDEPADDATDLGENDCGATVEQSVKGTKKICGGEGIAAIPGFPGERIDKRLLPSIKFLVAEYKIHITDGFALSGHAASGEHPRAVALDIGPGNGGTWADIDRLAKWAEPTQNQPRPPFRWVGYNGDANHGSGHHLHLSFNHDGAPFGKPPRCVTVLDVGP